jgi:hypothetical protein
MATIYLKKLYNTFCPADQISAEAMEEMKPNGVYKAVLTQPRSYPFHKRFFSLLQVAFEAWEISSVEHKGRVVEKNFDRFRKDITILCGYYETVFNIKGEMRLEAKSISFANMEQGEFEKLYSRAIDVILKEVLSNYTAEDLDSQVNKILGFC